MKHPEGMRVSLVEEGMLNGSGVLKGAQGTSAMYGLTDKAIQLFLLIAGAGEDGLAQSKLPRELKDNLEEALLPLEMQSLVDWQRDNRGRKAYLVLTWKGKEALEAAKTKPTNTETWANRRRAAVTPAGGPAPRQDVDSLAVGASPRRAGFGGVQEPQEGEHPPGPTVTPSLPSEAPKRVDSSFFAALDAPSSPGTRRAATRRRAFGPPNDLELSALVGVGAELEADLFD